MTNSSECYKIYWRPNGVVKKYLTSKKYPDGVWPNHTAARKAFSYFLKLYVGYLVGIEIVETEDNVLNKETDG